MMFGWLYVFFLWAVCYSLSLSSQKSAMSLGEFQWSCRLQRDSPCCRLTYCEFTIFYILLLANFIPDVPWAQMSLFVFQALDCPGKLLIFHSASLVETELTNTSGFFGSYKPKVCKNHIACCTVYSSSVVPNLVTPSLKNTHLIFFFLCSPSFSHQSQLSPWPRSAFTRAAAFTCSSCLNKMWAEPGLDTFRIWPEEFCTPTAISRYPRNWDFDFCRPGNECKIEGSSNSFHVLMWFSF